MDHPDLLDTLARKLVQPLVDRSRWQAPTLVRVDGAPDVRSPKHCPPYGVKVVGDATIDSTDAEAG
jgi:hypothetical protein